MVLITFRSFVLQFCSTLFVPYFSTVIVLYFPLSAVSPPFFVLHFVSHSLLHIFVPQWNFCTYICLDGLHYFCIFFLQMFVSCFCYTYFVLKKFFPQWPFALTLVCKVPSTFEFFCSTNFYSSLFVLHLCSVVTFFELTFVCRVHSTSKFFITQFFCSVFFVPYFCSTLFVLHFLFHIFVLHCLFHILFHNDHFVLFFEFLEDTSPFCEVTDTPFLDFW